jgi:hypothetical protein
MRDPNPAGLRSSDAASRGRTIVFASLALAFVMSFIAVSQHVRCVALGYEVDQAERRQVELLRRRAIARGRLATLRSPAVLLRRNDELGLGLGYPEPDAPTEPDDQLDDAPGRQLADHSPPSSDGRAEARR